MANVFSEWAPPHSPTDDVPNVLPLYDLDFNANQVQMRHMLYVNFAIDLASSGAASSITGLVSQRISKPFEWQIYDGEDPQNPDYIYIRQRVDVNLLLVAQVISGPAGIGFSEALVIPGEFVVTTTHINNQTTDKYVKTGDDDPDEPNPDNPAWKYTLGGTEFGEQMLFAANESRDIVVIGDAVFLNWAEGAVYYIDIPLTAKFSVVNPPAGIGDKWSSPVNIRNSTYMFRFKEGGSPAIDSVYDRRPNLSLIYALGTDSVIVKGVPSGLKVVKVLQVTSNPSITEDKKGRLWVLALYKDGYFEQKSDDGGTHFEFTDYLWDTTFKMADYIYIPQINARGTVASTDKTLFYKGSNTNFSARPIAYLDKVESYSLSINAKTGAIQVLNSSGVGYYSPDYGNSWYYPNGIPAMAVASKAGSISTVIGVKASNFQQAVSDGWHMFGTSFEELSTEGWSMVPLSDGSANITSPLTAEKNKNYIFVYKSNGSYTYYSIFLNS